jgi:hypothetical protein
MKQTAAATSNGAVTMTTPADGGVTKLDDSDILELARYEGVIARGIATFYEVGTALLHIRDQRLYRATHDNFEEYCRERWNMSRPRAYQLIDAANIAANLSTGVDTLCPANERQIRELASLPPDDQRTVWAQGVGESNGKQPTPSKLSELKRLVKKRLVERPREAGIVEPTTITQCSEDEPPQALSKRDQRRLENERESRVYNIMSAIDTLNEPGFPPSELVAHIRRTYPREWIVVTEIDNALRNLQMIVKELKAGNTVPTSANTCPDIALPGAGKNTEQQAEPEQDSDDALPSEWLRECCVKNNCYSGGIDTLYLHVTRWSAEHKRSAPASQRAFERALQAEGFVVTTDGFVDGLRLRESLPESSEPLSLTTAQADVLAAAE